MLTKVLNASGERIVLNDQEARVAQVNQRKINNETGYEVDVTTLTAIQKKVSEQKFYHVPFADYIPVQVGEGQFAAELLTYRSFSLAADFEAGIIDTGSSKSRLEVADAAIDAVTVKVNNWAKEISWSYLDLQLATRSGEWSLIEQKEVSRKTNWDLGLQKVAFLGMDGTATKGLLNQAGVTVDAGTLIPVAISDMTPAQFKTFAATILKAYRANCDRTAMPTHFVLPESDYLGLATPISEDFPIKSKLQQLTETFQTITGNKEFKILPSAYADDFGGVAGAGRYALYAYDERSIRIDIPTDYVNTIASTLNGFTYQNVGYGQFTGAMAYRPKELFYMDKA